MGMARGRETVLSKTKATERRRQVSTRCLICSVQNAACQAKGAWLKIPLVQRGDAGCVNDSKRNKKAGTLQSCLVLEAC